MALFTKLPLDLSEEPYSTPRVELRETTARMTTQSTLVCIALVIVTALFTPIAFSTGSWAWAVLALLGFLTIISGFMSYMITRRLDQIDTEDMHDFIDWIRKVQEEDEPEEIKALSASKLRDAREATSEN